LMTVFTRLLTRYNSIYRTPKTLGLFCYFCNLALPNRP
jgi:hypothetical protein